ncbi:unnamed protein product [Ectocarpus sp. 6 AP-2014]
MEAGILSICRSVASVRHASRPALRVLLPVTYYVRCPRNVTWTRRAELHGEVILVVPVDLPPNSLSHRRTPSRETARPRRSGTSHTAFYRMASPRSNHLNAFRRT